MRFIKMLGLAAVAALAAMAFVGATSASADTACLENVGHANECPPAKRWTGNVTGLTNAGEPALLLDSFKNVLEKCNSEVLALWIENEGSHKGVKYLIDTAGIKFTGCTGICNKATSEAPAWLLVEALALDAWVSKHGTLAVSAKLEECEFGVNCLYRFTNETQLLKAESDFIIAKEVPLTESTKEFLCPNSTTWDGKYLVREDETGGTEGGVLYAAALP